MSIDLEELERLAHAASPGPWSGTPPSATAQSGTGQSETTPYLLTSGREIWCDGYPVATVTQGPWGPDYPALRVEGEPPQMIAVPYISRATQGTVPGAVAAAN